MNLFSRWKNKTTVKDLEEYCCTLTNELIYKRLAIETAIDLIANTISRVEFITYSEGKRVENDFYYMWNVSPNCHESKVVFIKKIIRQLIFYNDCLIVTPMNHEKEMYVSDGWSMINEKAVFPNTFTSVSVNNFTLNQTFDESETPYFKYSNENIKQLIDNFYSLYGVMIASATNVYKRKNARRFALKSDLKTAQTDDYTKKLNDMITSQFKAFLEADNAGAIAQLANENELIDFSDHSSASSKDYTDLIDGIYDIVARAFHIPKGLLKGDTVGASEQIDEFLMFTILPIVGMIEAEINKKQVDKADYLKGTRVRADTSKLRIVDIGKQSEALYKLFQIGAKSINDCILETGGDPIHEDWANTHYVTKNFTTAKEDAQNNTQKEVK